MVISASCKKPYSALLHALNGNALWAHEVRRVCRYTEGYAGACKPQKPVQWCWHVRYERLQVPRNAREKSSTYASPAELILPGLMAQPGRDLPRDLPREVKKEDSNQQRDQKQEVVHAWATSPGSSRRPRTALSVPLRLYSNKPHMLDSAQNSSYRTKGSSASSNSKSLRNDLLVAQGKHA